MDAGAWNRLGIYDKARISVSLFSVDLRDRNCRDGTLFFSFLFIPALLNEPCTITLSRGFISFDVPQKLSTRRLRTV